MFYEARNAMSDILTDPIDKANYILQSVIFKTGPFCIRHGWLNADWICYCWNGAVFLESGKRAMMIGGSQGLLIGFFRGYSWFFAISLDGLILFSTQSGKIRFYFREPRVQ